MERDGHLGITLLLYTPIAALLSTTATGSAPVLGFGLAATVGWSLVPDIDELLPIPHRGPTHSFVAAAFAGLLTALLGIAIVDASPGAAGFGFAVGLLGVTSHLLGDVITPMGIRPWWPFSDRNYSLSLVLSADVRANLVLALSGTGALLSVLVVDALS